MFKRLGSIISGTLRPEDLYPCFVNECMHRFPERDKDGKYDASFDVDVKALEVLEAVDDETYSATFYATEYVSQSINDDLPTKLEEDLPPFVYFGAHKYDGADFGYWFDMEAFEASISDGDTLKVADAADIDYDKCVNYEYVAVVNDHGNVTLYATADILNQGDRYEPLWSIV